MATTFADAQTSSAMLSSVCEAPAFTSETYEATASYREYGSCIQGFMVGLFLEAALALCLYGMYHLGHVLR
jgi:hypothetical protein